MSNKVTVYTDSPAQALIKSLESPALDPMVLALANDFLSGKNYDELAEEFGVGKDVVVQLLNQKEVKAYVDNVFLTQGYASRYKRLELINRIIDKKLEKAGDDDPSEKDVLDWLKLAEAMDAGTKSKDKNNQVNVQINNNYTKLMNDLLKDK